MVLIDVINQRRSVRRFTSRSIPKEEIMKCVEAARLAPSACNSQPWHFMILDDPELKDRVADRIFAGVYSMNKFAKEAPVLVVVISEKIKFLAALGGKVRDTRYELVDVGIACEHFVLQAQERGIGSCWIGWFDEKALKKVVKVPKDKKIDIVIALGYPAEENAIPKTRKSLEAMCSFNQYPQETSSI